MLATLFTSPLSMALYNIVMQHFSGGQYHGKISLVTRHFLGIQIRLKAPWYTMTKCCITSIKRPLLVYNDLADKTRPSEKSAMKI